MARNRKTQIMFDLILLVCLIISSFTIVVTGNSTPVSTSANISDTNRIKLDDTNGPIIDLPTINPTQPVPGQDITVNSRVHDVDGIDTVQLYWEYNSNTTIYNTTMNSVLTPITKNDNNYEMTGYVDASGSIVQGTSNWAYLDYEYSDQQFDGYEITVGGQGATNLVYVRIEFLNTTSGNWQQLNETGSTGSQVDLGTKNFNFYKLIGGVRMFALTYRANGGPPSTATYTINLLEQTFQGSITGNINPATVSYHIVANDTNGLSTNSPVFNIVIDNVPILTFWNLPTSLNSPLNLNVSVFDADGVGTIDNSSVTAYYKLTTDTNWNSVGLTYSFDDLINTAFYTTTINLPGLSNTEATYDLMVNASDIINSNPGITASTGLFNVVLDQLGPMLTHIGFKPGTFIMNYTSVDTDAEINASFLDISGISNVTLYYSDPNSSNFNPLLMTNTTNKDLFIQNTDFNAIIPSSNMSGYVDYYFEVTDYLNNTRDTSMNRFVYDSQGPVIVNNTALFTPMFISNITDVTMLFNATDPIGVQDATVWYSYNGDTWQSTAAATINYANHELINQIFDSSSSTTYPLLLENMGTTSVTLNVQGIKNADVATMSVDITYDRSSDLRIWLTATSGENYLIFDREVGVSLNNLQVNLFDLGIDPSSLENTNFTLEIDNFGDTTYGFLNAFSIKLIQYEIPMGYQYLASIPKSNNDTDVMVFVTLTDNLANVVNSSTFSYHTDGLAPNLTINPLSGIQELKDQFIRIEAEANDSSGISNVEIHYRFSDDDQWEILFMDQKGNSDTYTVEIPLIAATGNVTYYIRAFDNVGLASTSNVTSVLYIIKNNIVLTRILQIAGAVLIIGGIAGIVWMISTGKINLKKKTP